MIDRKKEFYLGIEGRNVDSFLIKHIQYNLHSRIFSLDYVHYKRIDLLMFLGAEKSEKSILLNDKRKVSIRITRTLHIKNVELPESIQSIYETVFDALKVLWDENKWPVSDVNFFREEIIKENYKVRLQFGKRINIPNRECYLDIICCMHPSVTEYYFDFSLNGVTSSCLFFQGFTDPVVFFGYFSLFKWISKDCFSISDFNEEISFVLDMVNKTSQVIIEPKRNSFPNCQLILKAFESSRPNHILSVIQL